jgi:hypothetical protein
MRFDNNTKNSFDGVNYPSGRILVKVGGDEHIRALIMLGTFLDNHLKPSPEEDLEKMLGTLEICNEEDKTVKLITWSGYSSCFNNILKSEEKINGFTLIKNYSVFKDAKDQDGNCIRCKRHPDEQSDKLKKPNIIIDITREERIANDIRTFNTKDVFHLKSGEKKHGVMKDPFLKSKYSKTLKGSKFKYWNKDCAAQKLFCFAQEKGLFGKLPRNENNPAIYLAEMFYTPNFKKTKNRNWSPSEAVNSCPQCKEVLPYVSGGNTTPPKEKKKKQKPLCS